MGNGPVYTSADSGVTWTKAPAPIRNWTSAASSSDGTRLVAVAADIKQIFVSTNSGVNWLSTGAPGAEWSSVASSADGSKLVAVAGGALGVGVFDAEDERAAVPPREEPVEERRPRPADVQVAGRRRRKAHPDGHLMILAGC